MLYIDCGSPVPVGVACVDFSVPDATKTLETVAALSLLAANANDADSMSATWADMLLVWTILQ